MDDNVAIVMHNTVCVVAFVLLAIAFKYWWLVFFALIFRLPTSNKNKKMEDKKRDLIDQVA